MNASDPIGIFDSGLGGLSVVEHIRRVMPRENLVFFADCARNPYGTRTKEEVRAFSHEIVERLAEIPVKAVVIACNTATSAAASSLRSRFDFDIIGMEPALKLAADLKTPSKIAVWATGLTLREDKFLTLAERFSQDHDVIAVPCPKLVELVERDELDQSGKVDRILDEYLEASKGADFIVLGCTHFVYFRARLQQMVSEGVQVVDGNEGTVRQLERVLGKESLLCQDKAPGTLQICSSDPEKIPQAWRLLKQLEEINHGTEEKRMADSE